MNERIKELWYQAVQPHTGDSWAEQTAFMEKFAELMVKEFIEVAGEQMGYSQYRAMRDKVTTHFGVKND